jgi:RimJ/RimL family protein N-acetyltransferase
MDNPIFLHGDKIYLRPVELDDLETFQKWFNNPELRQYLMVYYPISKLEEKEFIESFIRDKNTVIMGIVIKKTDKLIGNIALLNIDNIHRCASIGIALGDLENASRGYGTEALKLIIDYGFKTLNLHRIELFVHEFNERAFKAYTNIGFVVEGSKREALYHDGEYHDEIFMSVLKDEWLKKKKK